MKQNQFTEISKQEKLRYILETIKKEKITNYELQQNTGISQSGLGSITKGTTKSPRLTTINTLYNYLQQRNKEDENSSVDNSPVDLTEKELKWDKKKFMKLSIEKKLDVIFDQNQRISDENDSIIELIEKLALSSQISFAPILRHFKLKKDTPPKEQEKNKYPN